MKKQFVCVLLALALGMGLSPALAAEGDMALAVAGVPEDSPYLVWGELTATVEDYVEAVAGPLAACVLQGWVVDVGLVDGASVTDGETFRWDNTIEGVPFDRYLEETGFVDVSAGDWFAPYVEVCVEEGLMAGTGEGGVLATRGGAGLGGFGRGG